MPTDTPTDTPTYTPTPTATYALTPTSTPSATPTGAHYYVDDDGSNETGDGSQAKPWKTISYALTRVSGPDATIHVAAGTYHIGDMGGGWSEVFPINMKDGISLVGVGADVTILDAGQSAAVIKAVNIGAGERVAGFTIRNGYWPGSDHGGGLYISGSSPVVEDNTIINNDAGASGNAYHSGGGIYVKDGSPTIYNNTITNNGSTKLTGDSGGGIYVTGASSAPLIQGNIISNNTVWIGGAGIYVEGSSAISTIEANLIRDNTQASAQWVDHQESAGGIALYNSSATVRNNIIVSNAHTGLNLYGSASLKAYVVHNTFVSNTWHGISLYGASAASPITAINVLLVNNVLVANGIYGINEENAYADPAVSYNLFHNNGSGVYRDEGETTHLSTTTLNALVPEAHNNLDGDPAFVDQAGGDYHLTAGSPAIDAGDNNAPSLPDTDCDGQNRPSDGDCDGKAVVDVGADEFVTLVGDLDCDCDVDVADTQRGATRWRCKCGDSCYESRYDIDGDCDIDIVDIMLVSAAWGNTCP
jgi:parallel beta-helix repeat protein